MRRRFPNYIRNYVGSYISYAKQTTSGEMDSL